MNSDLAFTGLLASRRKGTVLLALLLLLPLPACFPTYSFSGSGGSGGEGSGGSGGGTGTEVELCTNGKDDDRDGMTDCADADCADAGYRCAAIVPEGWSGPTAYWTGGVSDAVPDCAQSGGYSLDGPEDLKGELSVAPSECPLCECPEAPKEGTPSLTLRLSDDKCPGTCVLAAKSDCSMKLDEGCHALSFQKAGIAPEFDTTNGLWVSLQVTGASVSGGTCVAPEPTETEPPDLGYAAVAKLCRRPAAESVGRCDADSQACSRTPAAPFSPDACIYKNGDVSCPEGWTERRAVYYAAVEDSRGCTECTCEPNWDGAQVTGTISEHGKDELCEIPSLMAVTYDGTKTVCSGTTEFFAEADLDERYYRVTAALATPGSCQASALAGEPTGTVTGNAPITICCAP